MQTIITSLDRNHQELRELFRSLSLEQEREEEREEEGKEGGEDVEVEQKERLFVQLYSCLSIHILTKAEILYAPLLGKKAGKQDALKGYTDDQGIMHLLEGLAKVPVDSEDWTKKFNILRENVSHCLNEEKNVLFPLVESEFRTDVLLQFREEFEERRNKLCNVS